MVQHFLPFQEVTGAVFRAFWYFLYLVTINDSEILKKNREEDLQQTKSDRPIFKEKVGNWAALKHGIRNPETETESWKRKRKRNTESNINDSKLKNFTWHNLSTIQREFVLVFLAVPLNIFLLLCLDKVCRSVGYCTARPMKVILRVMFIHEFMGWIIQLNITFVANCQE